MDSRRAGFSLIELVVVMAILGLVAVYMGKILTVNEKTYSQTDQLSQAQQNLRAIDDLVERDLRHAGLMVPDAVAVCGVDSVNGPDILYLSDALAIDPQGDFNTYAGASVTSGNASSLGSGVTLTLSDLIIEPSPPNRPAYDTNGDGIDDSDFQVKGGVIISSTSNPTAGVACGTIEAVNVGGKQITVNVRSNLSATPDLIAVPAHEYRIQGTQLLWNGNALADGVEDLQVIYIIDNDDDNQVDVNEIFGDDETTAHQLFNQSNPSAGSGSVTLTTSVGELMREIEVNIVVRARLEDEDFNMGLPQRTGNRSASGVTADGFRRRVITTKVMLRNVAMQI